jgi:predicted enzyme related to lactoylglutathione lyase
MVEGQASALHFYTTVLGFEKRADIPMGQMCDFFAAGGDSV